MGSRLSRPRRRAGWWLCFALLVPLVGLLMFMSLRWSDTSDRSAGVVELRFDGVSHPRTQFLLKVSTINGTRMLQVGGLRVWILGDRVVFPASMVGHDGDYLSLPIGEMSAGWHTLQAIDPEIDFSLSPRQGRYASDRELEVLELVVPSDEFDPAVELVGRSISIERSEKLTTVVRVIASDGGVMSPPQSSSISPVPPFDVQAIAELFERLQPLLER